MPPSAVLELFFGVLRAAKVGRGKGESSHAAKETSLFWVGFVPQQRFGRAAVLPAPPSHGQSRAPQPALHVHPWGVT